MCFLSLCLSSLATSFPCLLLQDGVAPRAKMNQQRSRRFRAAQEATIKKELEEKLHQQMAAEGRPLPPAKDSFPFDSNCITPGTQFMQKVALCLQHYITDRMNSDPGWKDVSLPMSCWCYHLFLYLFFNICPLSCSSHTTDSSHSVGLQCSR